MGAGGGPPGGGAGEGGGGGLQSGSIRFSHRPRRGVPAARAREERRRPGDGVGLARLSRASTRSDRTRPAWPPRCPRGRSAPPKAPRRRSPRGGRPGCRRSPLRPRRNPSPRSPRERINLRTRKCKQKEKGEQRADRLR